MTPVAIGEFLVENLLELIYPTRCVVCERRGDLICAEDKEKLTYIDYDLACSGCGAPFGRQLCTECMTRAGAETFAFNQAFSLLHYDKVAEAMILAYKDGNERRLAKQLATLLTAALPLEWQLWADGLTWIPADSLAVRRRGFDHMRLLAIEVSAQLGLKPYAVLTKRAMLDQRVLTRSLRRLNSAESFALQIESVQNMKPQMNLLLIDDVFTTGATLDAAASALKTVGIRNIRAVTIARVW